MEIKRIKDELTKQFVINSEAQTNSIEIRGKFVIEKSKLNRLIRFSTLLNILNKWRLSRLNSFFHVWSTNNTLIGVAFQFRSQVEDILDKTTLDLNEVLLY
jgi:hypothetical protein